MGNIIDFVNKLRELRAAVADPEVHTIRIGSSCFRLLKEVLPSGYLPLPDTSMSKGQVQVMLDMIDEAMKSEPKQFQATTGFEGKMTQEDAIAFLRKFVGNSNPTAKVNMTEEFLGLITPYLPSFWNNSKKRLTLIWDEAILVLKHYDARLSPPKQYAIQVQHEKCFTKLYTEEEREAMMTEVVRLSGINLGKKVYVVCIEGFVVSKQRIELSGKVFGKEIGGGE